MNIHVACGGSLQNKEKNDGFYLRIDGKGSPLPVIQNKADPV